MTGEYRYRIYGLTLRSPRPLPLLWPEPDADRAPDILLRFAPVAIPATPPLRQARRLAIHADGSGLFQALRGGRFLIRDGREITIDLPPDTPAAELHALLCGPPLGWLMCQRGQPPLHACVVQIGAAAVALAGDSGAGKSTLARALIARGHGLITDDQAVIDAEARLVQPGFPAMKLWQGAAVMAGDRVQPALRVREGLDKYYIPMPQSFRPQPLPLALVLVLSPGANGQRLEQAKGPETATLLLRHLYRPEFSRGDALARIAFQRNVALAGAVPLYRLERSADLADLPALVATVENLAARHPPLTRHARA